MKPFADRFYRSRAWRRCRDAYYVSQHGICQRCGNAGLIVHHVIELTPQNVGNPDITLNWDNLQLVCQSCHNTTHMASEATVRGLVFDAGGNLLRR